MMVILSTLLVLIFVESLLSIDNAVVLAVLARSVPIEQQKKVLTYGLVGAVFLRAGAVTGARILMSSPILKSVGAAYLIFMAAKHFWTLRKPKAQIVEKTRGFWTTLLWIELADLAFAVDSVLTGVALSNQYWIVVIGGVIGMIIMRFAATLMIKLLNAYPKLETVAYTLVFGAGVKLAYQTWSTHF